MKRLDIYPARPFIKWVGGKTQLLDDIKKILPRDLSRRDEMTYIEPFVGGGAVLFWILQEYPNITRAIINDINAELICTYRVIKHDVENLIFELNRLQNEYLPLNEVDRKGQILPSFSELKFFVVILHKLANMPMIMFCFILTLRIVL